MSDIEKSRNAAYSLWERERLLSHYAEISNVRSSGVIALLRSEPKDIKTDTKTAEKGYADTAKDAKEAKGAEKAA